MKSKSNTSIELLRIISMVLIIMCHYTVWNSVSNETLNIGFNRFLLEFINVGGSIGVNIFILITGYFHNNKITLKKLIKIWLQIFFYSLSIYLIFIVLGIETFSIKNFIKSSIPITFNQYWFASTYFVLMLFSPFLNKLFNCFEKKEHFLFNMVMVILFSVLKTFTAQEFCGNYLTIFVMLYSIGAYIYKYSESIKVTNKTAKIIIINCLIFMILSIISLDLLGTKIAVLSRFSSYFLSSQSVLVMLLVINVFIVFTRKKFENNLINIISTTTFGIYLIHDNEYIRKILWNKILKVPSFVNSPILILHMILCIIGIFVICFVIELIRKNTIEKLTNKFLNDKIDKVQEILNNKIDILYNKMKC